MRTALAIALISAFTMVACNQAPVPPTDAELIEIAERSIEERVDDLTDMIAKWALQDIAVPRWLLEETLERYIAGSIDWKYTVTPPREGLYIVEAVASFASEMDVPLGGTFRVSALVPFDVLIDYDEPEPARRIDPRFSDAILEVAR